MKNKIIGALLCTVIAVIYSPMVLASSVFDTTYQTTNTLVLKSPDGTKTQDISTNWYTILTDIASNHAGGVTGCWEKNGKIAATEMAADIAAQHSYIVTQVTESDGSQLVYVYTKSNTDNFSLIWNNSGGIKNITADSTGSSRSYITIRIENNNEIYTQIGCNNRTPMVSNDPTNAGYASQIWKNYLSTNVTENLPTGYEGSAIRQEVAPAVTLIPEYEWKVNTDGQLTITYLKNLEHFLTGTSWVNIIKMNDNWDGIDEQLETITSTPAGWLDEQYTLPAGAGYYMVRIDHDQQLDSPPWDTDHAYSVSQRWMQFYWDGEKAISGSTIGCAVGDLCNPNDRNTWGAAPINTYGLQALLTAPLTFLGTLPAKVASCTGISLPENPLMGTMVLPCLKTFYTTNMPVVVTIWQTVLTGIVAYWIGIRIFATIKDINNPNHDRIEVVQL